MLFLQMMLMKIMLHSESEKHVNEVSEGVC